MAKVITIGNFKGGVGKTTVAANLAFALREAGKSVLLVDLDSQGQSSLYVTGDDTLAGEAGGAETLLDTSQPIKPRQTPSGVDVLHGHRGLGRIDEAGHAGKEAFDLRPHVEALPYDFVIIDTPPDLAFRTLASLIWADLFLVVTKPDPVTQNSTNQLINVLRGFISKRWVKPGFQLRILLNMVDRASPSAVKEAQDARDKAPEFVLPIELTYRRDMVNRAFDQKIPVWQVKRLPKSVAETWRSLPQHLGLVDGGAA